MCGLCRWVPRLFVDDSQAQSRAPQGPHTLAHAKHKHVHAHTAGTEPLLLELLLMSRHRTLDPEEADFFFVPSLTTCFFHPISGAPGGLGAR